MRNITIDVSGKCNLDCEFCRVPDSTDMSLDKVIEIADSNDAAIVNISGREPFLYKDLLGLVTKLSAPKRMIHLSTNGTLIPEGLLDLPEEIRNGIVVQVSLPAGSKELYKEITGKDYLDKVIDNAKLLRDKYKVVLSTAIYDKNFDDVENILNISRDLKLPLRVNLIMPEGKGKDVKLLDDNQLNYLKGVLLVERIKRRDERNGYISSQLLNDNICPALAEAYNLELKGNCQIEKCDKIKYFDSLGNEYPCEFYKHKK
ncbi:MAG: radical SAM protein [Candidatus Nanoarchaeia archaeon]